MKKHIGNLIIFIICFFTTYCIYYNFIIELIKNFLSTSAILCVDILLFGTIILYVISISAINRKISKIHINIIALMYFIMTIVLSFIKTTSNFTGMNLNPLSILNDFRKYFNHTLLLVVTNTLLYLPLSIYIKFKVKIKDLKLFIGFSLYIFLIEIIQYVTHNGIFDVNDIILNTFGFFLGILCSDFIMKISIKKLQSSYC